MIIPEGFYPTHQASWVGSHDEKVVTELEKLSLKLETESLCTNFLSDEKAVALAVL
jgi:hypothetical protein